MLASLDVGLKIGIVEETSSLKALIFDCPLMDGDVTAGVHSSAILAGMYVCIAFYGNVVQL